MTARVDRLACGCWLVWLVGAVLARTFGIWVGIGGTAVALALVMLVQARTVLQPLLVPSPVALTWGATAAVVMIVATYVLYAVDRAGPGWTTAGTAALYRLMHAGAPPAVAAVLIPLVVVAEELVWRGVVQEALGRRLRPVASVLATGVAYASAHAPIGSPLLVVVALACGVYWSTLRSRTGSLVPSLVCHLAWDVTVMVLRPLA